MAEDLAMQGASSGSLDDDFAFEDKVGEDRDLKGDGGVVKRILRQGEGWERPESGDEVAVHYVGTLTDGTKFDSSRDRGEPFTFKLGQGRVIKGWDLGVAAMKRGELATLTCAPGYAYGAAGSPPTIPPNATLVFEVELLSWKSVKDVSGDGGVIKTVLSEGTGWATPKDEDEVVATYGGRILPPAQEQAQQAGGNASAAPPKRPPTAAEQGLPVVVCSPEGGAVFSLAGAPCPGLAAALRSMKPHEAARVLLSPTYAAGLADVPEGSRLELELTLSALRPVTHPAPGVTKKVMAETEGSYSRPNAGSSVRVTLGAASADGATVYEAPHEAEFVTDDEQAPEGVELALATMREGERALVTVSDAGLTAPPAGAVIGGGVPAGVSPVVYDITLTSFSKAKERWEMNNQEKLAAALSCKEKGNAAYKAGNITRAVRQYTAAYEHANSISERDLAPTLPSAAAAADGAASGGSSTSGGSVLSQAREVKKAAALNLAAAELKRGGPAGYAEAARQASKVLELDPLNVKALYRRAAARLALGEVLEAELDVRAGLCAAPDSADLAALQRKLKVKMRELNKKEAKLYGRMFAALGQGDAGGEAQAQSGGPAPMQEDAPAPATNGAATAPVVEAAA